MAFSKMNDPFFEGLTAPLTRRVAGPTNGMRFRQLLATAPRLGDASQAQRAAFVANANGSGPMAGSGPGMQPAVPDMGDGNSYQRGTGFSDSEWKRFDRAQLNKATGLEREALKLIKEAERLDALKAGSGELKRDAAANILAIAGSLRQTGADAPVANLYDEEAYESLRTDTPKDSVAFTTADGMTSNFSRAPAGAFGDEGLGMEWIIAQAGRQARGSN